MLTSAPVLQYFSPSRKLMIQCDTSQSGSGMTILQDGKIVAYTSRAMIETEKYSPKLKRNCWLSSIILKDMTHTCTEGILWSIQENTAAAPKRLQRMILHLQHYDFFNLFIGWKAK